MYKLGKSIRGDVISLKYRIDERSDHIRVAVVVSKKVSKSAVLRNRMRRRVFEIIREHMAEITPGFEAVFGVFDSSVATMPHEDLEKHVMSLVEKAK